MMTFTTHAHSSRSKTSRFLRDTNYELNIHYEYSGPDQEARQANLVLGRLNLDLVSGVSSSVHLPEGSYAYVLSKSSTGDQLQSGTVEVNASSSSLRIDVNENLLAVASAKPSGATIRLVGERIVFANEGKPFHWQLFDLQGRVLSHGSSSGISAEYDALGLSGAYVARLWDGKGSVVEKVLLD